MAYAHALSAHSPLDDRIETLFLCADLRLAEAREQWGKLLMLVREVTTKVSMALPYETTCERPVIISKPREDANAGLRVCERLKDLRRIP